MKNKYHCARHNHQSTNAFIWYIFFCFIFVVWCSLNRAKSVICCVFKYKFILTMGKKRTKIRKMNARRSDRLQLLMCDPFEPVSHSLYTYMCLNTTQRSTIGERHTAHPTTTTAAAKNYEIIFERDISAFFTTNCFSYDIISSDHECKLPAPGLNVPAAHYNVTSPSSL